MDSSLHRKRSLKNGSDRPLNPNQTLLITYTWVSRESLISYTKSNVWASKKPWNNYTEKEGCGSKRLEIRSLHIGAAEAGSAVITKTNMQTHVLPRLCMTAVSWLLIVIKSSTWGWSWPGEWSCCGREIIGVIFFALAVPLKRGCVI